MFIFANGHGMILKISMNLVPGVAVAWGVHQAIPQCS
jgi:hypothetical protein